MADFTIYRGSWRRGGDSDEKKEQFGDTSLLNDQKLMCCLGQCAFEYGVPLSLLKDEPEPVYINNHNYLTQLVESGLLVSDYEAICNTSFATSAMPINDDCTIDDAFREAQLTQLAKNYGHTITFVDGVAPWFTEVA